MVIPFTRKWLNRIANEDASAEKIRATSQTFSGSIIVNPEHIYLSRAKQEEILRELLSKSKENSND